MNFALKAELWQQMADLTMQKCRQKCRILGSCCSPEYCAMAADIAREHGVLLKETGYRDHRGSLPFLQADGKCSVPPHLRPLCSLHQCDIAGWGFCPEDEKWTDEYFKLREQLEG